jgi:hypothetical protein
MSGLLAETARDDARHWAAAFGIGGVCIGAVLVSIDASLLLSRYNS